MQQQMVLQKVAELLTSGRASYGLAPETLARILKVDSEQMQAALQSCIDDGLIYYKTTRRPVKIRLFLTVAGWRAVQARKNPDGTEPVFVFPAELQAM